MCCGDAEVLDLPPAVIEMLARYRGLAAERGWDWGDDRIEMFRWARFAALGDVFAAYGDTGDWLRAVRDVVGTDPPSGVAVVRVRDGGITVHCGPPRPVVAGVPMPLDVVVDRPNARWPPSSRARRSRWRRAGRASRPSTWTAPPRRDDRRRAGVARRRRLPDGRRPAAAARGSAARGGRSPTPPAARGSPTACCASGTSAGGRSSTPTTSRSRCRPTTLTVTCTRGLEFDVVERTVTGEALVEVEPPRRFDPAADGWYGGDLHVHMNYSGDLVCTPADVARMQRGEGLHLVNLVAGNLQTSLVYDRELLEEFAGVDLPWSDGEIVARAGVEYRNDLLGHVHALGPDAPPSRYYAGHERSDHPEDWPPNQAACARAAGVVGDGRLPAPRVRPVRRGRRRPTRSSPTRARSRPGSSWSTPRSGSSTRSTCSPRSTTRPPSTSTTGCCRAGCGSRRPRAPTCSSPSRTARASRPTRRGGPGSTPTSATRRCRWRVQGGGPRGPDPRHQRAVARRSTSRAAGRAR